MEISTESGYTETIYMIIEEIENKRGSMLKEERQRIIQDYLYMDE